MLILERNKFWGLKCNISIGLIEQKYGIHNNVSKFDVKEHSTNF